MMLQIRLVSIVFSLLMGCSLYADLEPIETGTTIPDLGEPDVGEPDLTDTGMDLSEYTVWFDTQGGTSANPTSKLVAFDTAYGPLASTSRTGYTFTGWWTASTSGTQVLDTTIVRNAADHTLYAQWSANEYTVTLKHDDLVTPDDTIFVTYDAPYGPLPEPTRTGYSFEGWWMAAGGTNGQVEPTTRVVIAGDHDLYAHWAGILNASDACTADAQCVSGECQRSYCKLPGFSVIPAGSFSQGSPLGEVSRRPDETQRSVTINRPLYLQETEVTHDEWFALMNNTPFLFTTEPAGSLPVTAVSWWDAIAYLNALSLRQGLQQCYEVSGCTGTPGVDDYSCTSVTFEGLDCSGYRLPTEAEWEYAARARTRTMVYVGDYPAANCEMASPLLSSIAWWCGNATSANNVGEKTANAWGLYDMIGNVWEWTWDWYAPYFAGNVADPIGPNTGTDRVYRGCSWDRSPEFCRAAFRTSVNPEFRNGNLGFRPARSIR